MEGCSTFQCRGEGFCFSDEGTSSLVGGGGWASVLMEEFFEKNCRMRKSGSHAPPPLWETLSLIVFSTKINLLLIDPEMLSSGSSKAKLFAKKFTKNSKHND